MNNFIAFEPFMSIKLALGPYIASQFTIYLILFYLDVFR